MPRRVHGVGPVPCEFMVVGEGPGWEEDRAGRPFVGKTGQELERHLDGYNLPLREDVFTTNIYREYRGKDYIYTPEALAIDEQDLLRELQQVKPHIIVPLGRHATRWVLNLDVDMDEVQGIPWKGYCCNDCGRPFATGGDYRDRVLAVGRQAEAGQARTGFDKVSGETAQGTKGV